MGIGCRGVLRAVGCVLLIGATAPSWATTPITMRFADASSTDMVSWGGSVGALFSTHFIGGSWDITSATSTPTWVTGSEAGAYWWDSVSSADITVKQGADELTGAGDLALRVFATDATRSAIDPSAMGFLFMSGVFDGGQIGRRPVTGGAFSMLPGGIDPSTLALEAFSGGGSTYYEPIAGTGGARLWDLMPGAVQGEVELGAVTPEPATWALLLCGAGLLMGLRRRRADA